jgi:hypothetical protein
MGADNVSHILFTFVNTGFKAIEGDDFCSIVSFSIKITKETFFPIYFAV